MPNTQHVGTITRCRENAVHKFWSFWITSVMSWYLFSFWGTSGALSWTVRLEYIAKHNVTYGQVSPCCRSSAILANSSRKPFPQPELYVIDSCVANINVPDCLSPWATVFLWWETVQDMHWLAMQFLFNWNVWNILFRELLLFHFLGEVWAMLLVTLCNFNVKKYF